MIARAPRLALAALLGVIAASCASGSDDDTTGAEPANAPATTASAEPAGADEPATTATTTTTTTTTTVAPQLPLGLDQPLVMFGPVSDPPPDKADWPTPNGSSDYYDLFDESADWTAARELLGAFKIHSWQARWYFTDEQLVQMSDFLNRHGIPLIVEAEPLDPPDPTECDHTESFEGPYEIEAAERMRDLGVEVAAYAIEQPYHYAHRLRGPGSCQYELDRVIQEVVAWVADLREVYPGVPVGSIEGLFSDPVTTAADYEIWLDAYEEAAGEPFAFQHIDVDWARPDWIEATLSIEEVVEARDIPFGVIYNGGAPLGTSEEWLLEAAERFAEYDRAGGTPTHTVFQSWVDLPDLVLPDSEQGAFSNIVVRHAGDRAAFDGELIATAGSVSGRLVDDAGAPLAGRLISAEVVSAGMARLTTTVNGVVPDRATEALVAVRVNTGDADRGPADADLIELSVTYADDDTNLVPNGDFTAGTTSWGIYDDNTGTVGTGSSELGPTLTLGAASSDEVILIDGQRFPVDASREFEFTIDALLDNELSSGAVVLIFFTESQESEIARAGTTKLLVQPVNLTDVTTDSDGTFSIDVSAMPGDTYDLTISTNRDPRTWPVSTAITVGNS